MNYLGIQAKLFYGYSKAATYIGQNYTFYRLGGAGGPTYNTGLLYNSGQKYGSKVTLPGSFDEPGTRWDKNGNFDQPDGSTTTDQLFDASGKTWDTGTFDPNTAGIGQLDFDSGAAWDGGENWDQSIQAYVTLPVSLNAEDMKYSRPQRYGKATWYALFDGTNAAAGDYFIGPQGTFFIAGLQPLLPILVVECNRVISLIKPQVLTGTGLVGYGGTTATGDGTTPATETVVAQGRPCSILQGTKGEKSEANLPGDDRSPWWAILLPNSGLDIDTDDILTDDLGRRYIISSAELSSLGWRITAMQAVE